MLELQILTLLQKWNSEISEYFLLHAGWNGNRKQWFLNTNFPHCKLPDITIAWLPKRFMCSLLSIIDSITGMFCNEIHQVLNATKLLLEKNILHKEIFDVINYNLIKLNCHKYNCLAKKINKKNPN